MASTLEGRQAHVSYAIWLGLIFAALAIGIDHRLGGLANLLALQYQAGASPGIAVTTFAVPCCVYLLFRLVRPFPFTAAESEPPASGLHWIGVLIVTLAVAAAVTFIASVVFQPRLFGHYRVAGVALPLAIVAGFLFVEASLVRKGTSKLPTPPYLDAGLISAQLIVPALLAWFVNISPQSGIGREYHRLAASDLWVWLLPLSIGIAILLVWWTSARLRARFRRSAAYRSLTLALWTFGIASYALFAVIARRRMMQTGDGPSDVFVEVWHLSYANPVWFTGFVALTWLVVAGVLYFVERRRTVS